MGLPSKASVSKIWRIMRMLNPQFEVENVPLVISWGLVQNFIYAIQRIESGEYYGDLSHYHMITGASDVLCLLGTPESRSIFQFSQKCSRFLRKHKNGDVYPPWVVASMVGYALRFSVSLGDGSCETA
jgi:hypothetical protein